MDSSGINCTVSLMRCDDILQIPPLNTDVINSVNIVSIDSKDCDVSSKTTELKRSARLSKKRTLNDDSVVEITDRLDDSNEGGKLCNTRKSNKTKSKISVTPKNDSKKYNNRDSVTSTTNASSELTNVNVSMVQPSLKNTIADNGKKISAKSLPRPLKNKISSKLPTVKNVSTVHDVNTAEHENSVNLMKLTRKRGRPPQREVQLLLRDATDKVNTICKDEIGRQKTGKDFPEPDVKSHDIYESDSTTQDEADRTSTPERSNRDQGPSKPKRKRIKSSNLCNVENVDNDSFLSMDDPGSVKSMLTIRTFEPTNIFSDDPNEPQPLSRDETFDREITLISNRFNVPRDTLQNIIERESVPVFCEKYSDTVTLSMVTVSPVVSMTTNKGKHMSWWDSDSAASVEYKIEPARQSAAYEKNNLKDTMLEISKAMPSWSLSIVADPPRYVISHMSIETYGTPVADKSVVLDRHFRASVYIDQRLEYKYCQRYTTASEIVNLIKELDTI